MFKFSDYLPQFQLHKADPKRKVRRQLVKQLGKRQARQMIRDRRSLDKVEAQIAEFAKQHAEKAKGVQP